MERGVFESMRLDGENRKYLPGTRTTIEVTMDLAELAEVVGAPTEGSRKWAEWMVNRAIVALGAGEPRAALLLNLRRRRRHPGLDLLDHVGQQLDANTCGR